MQTFRRVNASIPTLHIPCHAVYIEGSKIVDVSTEVTVNSPHVLNFKDAVISPGVIDVHIHLNEPGRVEWEGEARSTYAVAIKRLWPFGFG